MIRIYLKKNCPVIPSYGLERQHLIVYSEMKVKHSKTPSTIQWFKSSFSHHFPIFSHIFPHFSQFFCNGQSWNLQSTPPWLQVCQVWRTGRWNVVSHLVEPKFQPRAPSRLVGRSKQNKIRAFWNEQNKLVFFLKQQKSAVFSQQVIWI